MPREEEKDSLPAANQSPEPASSQSPEPVPEVGDSADNTESSVETPVEEASSISAQSPRDSTVSQSMSEESVCSKCGGKKVKGDGSLLLVSNSDKDLENLPASKSDEDLKSSPLFSSNEDLEKVPESQRICKCGLEDDEIKEEENETSQEIDAEAQETGDTASERHSPVVSGESPTEVSTEQEQELSSDSVEETSGSTTSDTPSENFAIITCVRPKPLSLTGPVQQRRRYEHQLDEVSIPLQERPGPVFAAVEEGLGGEVPPASGGSPQVGLSSAESTVQIRVQESRQSVTSREYKSMLKVVGCVIVLVFTIVFALLIAAQVSVNRRLGFGSDSNSTKELDRNATGGTQ